MQNLKENGNLFNYLKSKKIYLSFVQEFDVWKFIEPYNTENSFFLNANYNDDVLIYQNNQYNLVNYNFEVKNGTIDNSKYKIKRQFETAEEVWEQLIKPDIEEYYGIKIDE